MAKLGDVCTVVSGTTPKSSCPDYWNGTINWVTPAELTDDTDTIFESQRKITELAVSDSGLKAFPAGTVLLSSRAPIGKVAIAGREMYCNQGFKNLICSDAIYNRYLFHFLKSKTDYLNSLGRGATFKEISKNIVEKIEIPLPPLEEQRQIAAVLDKVTDLIAKRRAQLDKLDLLVKSRFVEMFGDPETNDKNWDIVPLSQICSVGSSKRIYQNEQCSNGIPFLRISDLMNLINNNTLTTDLYIPQEKYQELKSKGQVPEKGDILVTSRGTLGQCYIVKESDRFYFQDGMISWLFDFKNNITPLYLSHLFSMPGFHKQIDAMQSGSTVAYLSISMIKRLNVMVPDIKTQKDFAGFVKEIEAIKFAFTQSWIQMEILKKSLMQRYFARYVIGE